ncbi:MAG: hypothetical protein L0Y54_13215, partial [Sporichthyaceae bacterium]|nr:hypothetical protein [Sporichthyaceae bacterium]
ASKWTGYGSFWKGRLSEVATYRATLSAEQVAAQYNARNLLLQGQPARVVLVTDPASKTLTYVYDAASGQPLQTVDQRGAATKYGYNLGGFASQIIDGNGNAIKYVYDVRGNVVEQTSCLDESASDCSTAFYSYYPDATTEVLNPGDRQNDVLLTARDARSSDAADNRYLTTHTYDATTGNLLTTTAPLSRVTSFTYTTATTPAVGGGTTPAGLPWTKTAPGGGVTTLEYYANGDLARTTDAAGKRTDYTYTATGRVATETVYSSQFPAGVVSSYSYDGAGRVASYTGPQVTDEVTGEPRQLRTSTVYYEPEATGYTMRHRQEDLADPLLPVRDVTVHINTKGQQDRQVDAEGNQTLFHYSAFGQLDQTTYPDGQVVNLGYDEVGNPLYTEIVEYQPGLNLRPTTKTYDAGNRVVRIDDAQGGWYTTYDYTDNNRISKITRWDGAGGSFITEQNSYDDAGDLTQRITNNGRTVQTFDPDYAGRVERTILDPNGLLKRTQVYTYSPDDQVVVTEVQDGANNNAVVGRAESIYDPLGRTVASTTYTTSTLSPVARWRLDETTGTTATDSAGNSPASATGVTWSSDHGGSAAFDGTAGTGLTTAGPVLDHTRGFTVAAWVKLTTTPAGNRIAVSQDGTVRSGFALGYNQANNRWKLTMCAANTTPLACMDAYSTTAAVVGDWVHLAGSYDPTANLMRLYVNGQAEGTATKNGGFSPALG